MNKEKLYQLHISLYNHLKKQAHEYMRGESDHLKRYREDFEYYAKRPTRICKQKEMFNSIVNSRVIYIGDFHTFDQNTVNLRRILRVLLKNKKKMVLGVELVHQAHQHHLNAFLEGHLSEKEFLEDIDYNESWRFPWTHYKTIFQLAKKHRIPIYGLNSDGDMKKREQSAGKTISKILQKHPNAPLLVFFGEYHIVPNRLPKEVNEYHLRPLRYTIVHQNLDFPFWQNYFKKTAKRTLRFNEHEFCLMTSPPWMKYESLIYWSDNLYDDPEYDLKTTHTAHLTTPRLDDFIHLFAKLCQFLNLPEIAKHPSRQDFYLFHGHQISEFIDLLEKKGIDPTPYEELILKNLSFKISQHAIYFSPFPSYNKLITLAGMHIVHLIVRDQQVKKTYYTQFIEFFWCDFLGHLSNKIINPQKKCPLYQDFQDHPDENKKRVLKIIDDPQTTGKNLRQVSFSELFEIAQDCGQLCADNFFHKMRLSATFRFKGQYISLKKSAFNQMRNLSLNGREYQLQRKKFF